LIVTENKRYGTKLKKRNKTKQIHVGPYTVRSVRYW